MLQAEQILQDRYQLKQKLGHNASRQTWLAKDLRSQHTVVVKLLTFSDQVQWDNLRLFEREAHVLKQLNHPRIPKYRDYFCIDDQMLWFGLVQDYIPGSSLKELLRFNKTFSEEKARAIAREVLKILVYLHSLSPSVLHRDIKPSNLIQGQGGQIYLVDFGAVQDRAAAEGATFTVVGTYGYAPLEQLGGRATPASDLYALGATLIQLLTGIAPADLPQQDTRFQFADLVNLNPGFVRWLGRLTEPNLSQRFSTARQALEALKENQTAISSIVRSRPSRSRIHLKKSPSCLKIKIPVPWLRALAHPKQLAVLAGLAVCGWFLGDWVLLKMKLGEASQAWLPLAWLIVGIFVAGWFVLPAFGETTVYFNHQYFEIEWKLFGLCLRRQRGRTLEIDKVYKSEAGRESGGKIPEVALAVGVQEYVFGGFNPPLTEAECYWLVEEINRWLGLR
jgi:serine/threonine protein kinase